MEQVLILLVMLPGVTHAFFPAAETKCDVTHNTSLCSATLGGSVYIHVMANASGHQLWCKQLQPRPVNVFYLKRGKVTVYEAFSNRTEFFIHNGTLKITNVERNDSGQYSVDVFDPNGIHVKNFDFKLDVQENTFPIWIIACSAAGVLLIVVVVILCCVCCRARRRKKSGSGI